MTVIDGGPVVRLRSATDRPYDDAIAAARTCYSPRVIEPDEITDRQRRDIGPLTFDGGHHTVFQHATFEFALSGVSRQLVWSFLHGFLNNSENPGATFLTITPVPEPGALLTAAAGLAVGVWVLRPLRTGCRNH